MLTDTGNVSDGDVLI